jgi:RNA polymerase sigma-70 factor (ECF subfamily)
MAEQTLASDPVAHPKASELDRDLRQLIADAGARGLRIARRLVGTEDAEDAVQEALARTLPRIGRVQSLEAWFVRVLVNHCIALQRRRRFWRMLGLSSEAEALPAPGPDVQLGEAYAQHELRRRVGQLPPMQRTVLQLRYGEEMKLGEIAQLLGLGEETVKTHLARAFARLRKELNVDGR